MGRRARAALGLLAMVALVLGDPRPGLRPGPLLARFLGLLQPLLYNSRSPPYPEPPPNETAICSLAGRSCERHLVRTADGYLLTLIRIIGNRQNATPVLVQHGALGCSSTFLSRRDGSDLGYLLQDAGFDVWLGNFRGTTYSRKHVSMDPDHHQQFWNFSCHEVGLHDLPALVDYVLEHTGAASLQYVGHSMGATALLVLLSSVPSYNAKVRMASLLAPVVTVNRRGTRLIGATLKNAADLMDLLRRNKLWEVLPRRPALHVLANMFCREGSISTSACDWLYDEAVGVGAKPTIPDLLPIMAAFHPAGSSIRILEHYIAITLSRRFRPLGAGMYDLSPGADYNLSAITTPLAIYYSRTDGLADPEEVESWSQRFPNIVRRYMVPLDTFNHLDFIFAKEVTSVLHQPLIKIMTDF